MKAALCHYKSYSLLFLFRCNIFYFYNKGHKVNNNAFCKEKFGMIVYISIQPNMGIQEERERGTETKSALYIWMYVGNSKYIFSFYYTKKNCINRYLLMNKQLKEEIIMMMLRWTSIKILLFTQTINTLPVFVYKLCTEYGLVYICGWCTVNTTVNYWWCVCPCLRPVYPPWRSHYKDEALCTTRGCQIRGLNNPTSGMKQLISSFPLLSQLLTLPFCIFQHWNHNLFPFANVLLFFATILSHPLSPKWRPMMPYLRLPHFPCPLWNPSHFTPSLNSLVLGKMKNSPCTLAQG